MIIKPQKMTHNIYEPEYNWNYCWDSMLVRAIASNLEYARFGFFIPPIICVIIGLTRVLNKENKDLQNSIS